MAAEDNRRFTVIPGGATGPTGGPRPDLHIVPTGDNSPRVSHDHQPPSNSQALKKFQHHLEQATEPTVIVGREDRAWQIPPGSHTPNQLEAVMRWILNGGDELPPIGQRVDRENGPASGIPPLP